MSAKPACYNRRDRQLTRFSQRVLSVACLVALLLPTVVHGYGFSVHRLVNRAATTHLPSSFAGFAQWVDDLEALSTAADERKCCVSGESIKHYIDIDDYPEFFTGTLPHTLAAMVSQYGQSRVDGNGTVPWAIEASYNDLVGHFSNQDWTSAVASAADIGHYVADSHNPMHLTLNYNGQLTGQFFRLLAGIQTVSSFTGWLYLGLGGSGPRPIH